MIMTFVYEASAFDGLVEFNQYTSLGSNLEIKSTKVSLSDTEPVDIPEQDFGFDIVNGKTSVDISTGN